MKKKFIPLEKQSKQKQKEYHAAQRGSWGAVNPVTKKSPNPKAYKRKKSEPWYEYEPSFGFSFLQSESVSCLAACRAVLTDTLPLAVRNGCIASVADRHFM